MRSSRYKITIPYIVSFLFPFAIWLSNFDFFNSGITIGDIILIVCLLLSLTYSKNNEYKNNETRWIALCIFAQLLISAVALLATEHVFWDSVIKRSIKLIIYTIAVFRLRNRIDIKTSIHSFEVFLYITTFGIIIQYAVYYIFGSVINVIRLPLLRYPDSYFTESFNSNFRPSSIFLEPAHLTQFTIPIIVIELFKSDKKALFKGLIFSFACVLTTSGTAIFVVSSIWILYIIIKSKESFKSFVRTVIIVIMISLLVFFVYNNIPSVQFAIERLSESDSAVYSGRLYNGDYLTKQMTNLEKIIGVGFGNVDMSIYMSSARYIYYSGGVIVSILWIALVIYLLVKEKIIGKIVIICFVALCFSSRIFLSMSMCYYLLFCIISYDSEILHSPKNDNRNCTIKKH